MPSDPASNPPGERTDPPQRDATLLQVAGAVFGSFLGIRNSNAMQRDAVRLKPVQVIVVALMAAALFVLTLVLIVRFVIAHA